MITNEELRKKELIVAIKQRAYVIGRETSIQHAKALDAAAVEKGFRNYNAAITSVKHGAVDSEKPLLFCCRCSRVIENEEDMFESNLSPLHQSFKLCRACLSKEYKALRRNQKDRDRITKELLTWYAAPKMTHVSRLIRALVAQKGIGFPQAKEIIAITMGFVNFDSLVIEAEKYKAPKKEIHIRRSVERRVRVEKKLIETRRYDFLTVQKMIRAARMRLGNKVFEKSSGTMHSRVRLLPVHCSPIDTTAARVVFYPYGRRLKE